MRRRPLALLATAAVAVLLAFLGQAVASRLTDTPPAAPSATPAATPAATPPTTAATAPPRTLVQIALSDPEERARAIRLLVAAGYEPASDASVEVSDRPRARGEEYAVRSWALVVHPRSPLLDTSESAAHSVLTGRIPTWDLLGVGRPPAPVRLVADAAAERWLDASHPRTAPLESAPTSDVLAAVASDPDAVGVVAVDDLDASVRALTVGGYDPYRDPARDNPLAETRTVAPTGTHSADAPAIDAKDIARVLGWDAPRLDPAGLLASGEAIPVRCSHSAALAHERGFDAMFDATREVIAAADVAVVPWEPALNEGDVTPCERSFHLVASPATAAAAADAGFDVALAAGNHVGDCVETAEACDQGAAVLATLEHLRAAGLLVAGAGADLDEARAPAVLTADGVTFAFLAYDDIAREFLGATADLPGTAPLDLAMLAVDVAAAKARADHVVVGFSWGVEYTSAPTARQREAAGVAVAAGASLVVGNHPHWVQATERIGDAFVAYGLGNFVFDQDGFEERTQGAVLEAGFTRERLLGVRLRPTAIRERHRPEFVVPHSGESRAILGRIWDATDALPPRESLPEAKD